MKVLVMYENSSERQAAEGLARIINQQGRFMCMPGSTVNVEMGYGGGEYNIYDSLGRLIGVNRSDVGFRVDAMAGPFDQLMPDNPPIAPETLAQIRDILDGKRILRSKPKPVDPKQVPPVTIRQLDFEDDGT